jgi:hypothetical protein
MADAASHDATTTTSASVHARAAFTLHSGYRIHARRHNLPSSWLKSWKEFVEVQ